MVLVAEADVSHEADISTPLHHGVIRYDPTDNVPLEIRNKLPAKNDRPFVYVPVGYIHREADFLNKILDALALSLPNIVVVTAESQSNGNDTPHRYQVRKPKRHPRAREWTKDHTTEVLEAKVGNLLDLVLESSMGVGAWLLPDCPRRRNPAAQKICSLLPPGNVALGLIGLNEEAEQDTEMRQSLQNVMVPIGSPVRNVCQLAYDPSLKDAAPCAELSHILIFESAEEKHLFRQALLDVVPDFMLAFGNITPHAMKMVFENANNGSPIILMKHTSLNIDKLCAMFAHVKRFQEKYPYESLAQLPQMKDNELSDEMIRLFLHTWPTGFQNKSVVMADPLITTRVDLKRKLLDSLMTCFGLKAGGANMIHLKRQTLDYAWSFYDAAKRHAQRKKLAAEVLNNQLVIFTLASIVASVMYNQWYGGGGHPSGTTQMCIYVSTILLPLYVTSLKQESDKGSAGQAWGAFEVATARIYSEIIKFRTQVGPYYIEDKTETAHQQSIAAFNAEIQKIWTSVKPFLHEDGMEIPIDFWHQNDDLTNLIENSKLEAASLQNPADESTPLINSVKEKAGQAAVATVAGTKAVVNVATAPAVAVANAIFHKDDHPAAAATNTDEIENDIDPEESADSEYDEEESDDDTTFVDDKFSPMQVEDYIKTRMQTTMNVKTTESQSMVSRNDKINFTVKSITMFSGATAALQLQWFVPIILGITAALTSGQQFRRYPRRIERSTELVVQLNELKLWWMSLSVYEKQLPHHKNHLVQAAEKQIVQELVSLFNDNNIGAD